MQFIYNEDNNLYGYAHGEKEFEFPTNIKQMGCLDDTIRIYMEDYVYTYLYQYAKTGGNKEKLAALVGRHMIVENQEVIIISGAIQGKGSIFEKGVETFTDDTWSYINTQMDVYFKGLSIVGWVHTQPGFGSFLMSRDEIFHKECFKNNWQVLYVIDPIEKMDTFYIHNSERTGLKAAKGYFIYYDKNEEMQEYMLNNSLVKPKISVEQQKELNKSEGVNENENIPEKDLVEVNDRIDAATKIRKVLKKKEESATEKKSRVSILAGISGVLCIACILMCVSLVSNFDRINKLESEIVSVKTSYKTIAEQLETERTVAVYAPQAESVQASEENKASTPAFNSGVVEAQAAEQPTEADKNSEPNDLKDEDEKSEIKKLSETQMENIDIPEFYTVEEGDNLGYISLKFYESEDMVENIMEANGIEDADKIFYGEKLVLPKN